MYWSTFDPIFSWFGPLLSAVLQKQAFFTPKSKNGSNFYNFDRRDLGSSLLVLEWPKVCETGFGLFWPLWPLRPYQRPQRPFYQKLKIGSPGIFSTHFWKVWPSPPTKAAKGRKRPDPFSQTLGHFKTNSEDPRSLRSILLKLERFLALDVKKARFWCTADIIGPNQLKFGSNVDQYICDWNPI